MDIIIEESILIHSNIENVWKIFTDITCWNNWNTVMRNVSSNGECLCSGSKILCYFKPFLIPIKATIQVEEVVPCNRVVWSAKKKGFFARNRFTFHARENGVLVTSREIYSGAFIKSFSFLVPKKKMRTLIRDFLNCLKKASET